MVLFIVLIQASLALDFQIGDVFKTSLVVHDRHMRSRKGLDRRNPALVQRMEKPVHSRAILCSLLGPGTFISALHAGSFSTETIKFS